jgi:hypothetical protein
VTAELSAVFSYESWFLACRGKCDGLGYACVNMTYDSPRFRPEPEAEAEEEADVPVVVVEAPG